jgi:hypothetical protein
MPSSEVQVPKKLQGPSSKAPAVGRVAQAVPGPEGRPPVATGEAQRNPWNETPPVKSSAPAGRMVWMQHGHAPRRGAVQIGRGIPRVPRAGARSTRGYRPACLRHGEMVREGLGTGRVAQSFTLPHRRLAAGRGRDHPRRARTDWPAQVANLRYGRLQACATQPTPAVPGPEGRLPVATGEAQRNPWSETPPVKPPAPAGRVVWMPHRHAPLRGTARVGRGIPRVPRAGARSTRGYRQTCLRHAQGGFSSCETARWPLELLWNLELGPRNFPR